LNEKQSIEYETAKAFLKSYNCKFGTSYRIVECSDAPDVLCKDESGRELKLEITLTEDREGDVPAILGRSNSRDINVMIEKGLEHSVLQKRDVIPILTQRIQSKLNKDYGENVALVVRDTSGVPWDWTSDADDLKESLDLSKNNYDRGIWIITREKKRIFRIV
jgi:hypothetical protein